jgi:response regulator NasT
VILLADIKTKLTNLEQILTSQSYLVVASLESTDSLYQQAQLHQADVIIIDHSHPGKIELDAITQLAIKMPTPLVMFSRLMDDAFMTQAVKAGVHAYVTEDVKAEKIKGVIQLAKARFEQLQSLTSELYQVKSQLEERKIIEKAKGIIMKNQGCDEPAAYKALRDLAMDRSQRIFDVAKNVICVMDLMKAV